ncbi:MAG: hypothetical protein RLZZ385_1023 [Pseudomonadota bacterium]|jgi:23S rRNA (cytosine1962-C5)-methyltransferase
MHTVHLKKGREASLLRHHPWVFSGAIERITGQPDSGATVRVVDSGGNLLGIGGFSPHSQIRVRLYCFREAQIDREFLAAAIARAIAKRAHLTAPLRSACRLVFGESDGLPGLIVDRYNDVLVCQILFAGMERWKADVLDILQEQTRCVAIVERSDSPVREKEGLSTHAGLVAGSLPAGDLIIQEYGMSLAVDVVAGQKTGFYLDQAENRHILAGHCEGQRVLNCFSYTGGFSVAALLGNASQVISMDSSAPALAAAQANVARNGIAAERHQILEGNAFNLLRELHQQQRQFDVVILDPPKFADNKSQVLKAARAYKDLALQAVKLIPPGGKLVNFSCSGAIDLNLFQKITADALLDAERQGEVIRYLHQGEDHPVGLAFPESQYLKGLICRIND